MKLEPLHLEQIMDELSKLKGWDELNQDYIKKSFLFLNFQESINFVNKISILAEEQQHHPTIIINYDKVTIKLSTHEAEGITQKDFELAKKIDSLFEEA